MLQQVLFDGDIYSEDCALNPVRSQAPNRAKVDVAIY